jgi:hypothetical protein
MGLVVILPVVLEASDFGESEAVVVECPQCFLIVRKSRLDDHKAASHA